MYCDATCRMRALRQRRGSEGVVLEAWGGSPAPGDPPSPVPGGEVEALAGLVLELRGAVGALARLGPRMRGPLGARVEEAAADLGAVMVRCFPDG